MIELLQAFWEFIQPARKDQEAEIFPLDRSFYHGREVVVMKRSGGAANVKERYWKRYVPGQRSYFKTRQPKVYADIIIINNDPMRLRMIVSPPNW